MRKSIYLCILLLLSASITHELRAAGHEGDDKMFTEWKERVFMDSLWANFPEWASQQGYHKYDNRLNIPDDANAKTKMIFIEWVDAELKKFDFAALSDLNKTDYKLLQNFIKSTRFYTLEFKENEWNPASYNVGDAVDYVINNNPAPLDIKLKNLGARMNLVPAYYEAAKKNINHPTREHLDLAIAQTKGLIFMFSEVIQDSIRVSTLGDKEKTLLTERTNAALRAVKGYILWLKEMEGRLTKYDIRSFAIGKEMYAKKFAVDIAARYSADEMYQKAVNRKSELHNEMYDIAVSLWPRYMAGQAMPKDSLVTIKMIVDKLSEHHSTREDFMATIEKQMPELVKFIEDNKLIELDPSKPLRVRKTPEYMAGVAGASINSPGPYDKEGNNYYNVTPLTDYTPEMAESYLREYNDYVLQILNIHEAIPGHYVQLIYANRSPSIIKSVFGNGAMIEGWACYVERMMIEAGYHASPEMKLFYDKWNLREACNFLLDYGMHVKGWSQQQVMDLLVKEAFQQEAEATEKYKRATLSQVQLASYFSGQTEILELREEMKKNLGKSFNLKKFHEQFLSYGSAPVREIRELMLK
jgi:uncharacterized protein (DUF885 family)